VTPAEFKSIRQRAGLTQSGLAALLRLKDSRSIRMMESGDRAISGPIGLLMELLDSGRLP
jgi:DNA-binding transcriptional regulator YiaG